MTATATVATSAPRRPAPRGGVAEAIAAGLAPLAFVACLVVAVTAVWVPAPYESLADWGLRAAGLQERLQSLDQAVPVDALANRSADLARSVADLFEGILGGAGDDDPAVAPEPETSGAPEPGLIERSLYPGLVAVIALVLRGGALAAALAGLIATTALGWAARAVRASRHARAEAKSLEARIAALEARLPTHQP